MSRAATDADTVRVLDCTIRDGGFYNGWDFPSEFVRAYLRCAGGAGVDVVEIGYRSPAIDGFAGAYKYSEDALLARLLREGGPAVAVMIDSKELEGREALVGSLLRPAAESPVSLVRFATAAKHMDTTLRQVEIAAGLGYRTTVNLMAYGSVEPPRREALLRRIATSATDVLYIADSYGSLYPEDVAEAAALIRAVTDKPWGIHLHNNQELAFANAICAMDEGATWIDSSVLGMGRGPGNLRTELFLQYLQGRRGIGRYHAEPVYEFIDREMAPVFERHRWGPTSAYVLSGNLGVHPTYAQNLLSSGRYRASEVVAILRRIHDTGSGASFSREVLDAAITRRTQAPGAARAAEPAAPGLSGEWAGREVLVVGRGPSVDAHSTAVNEYIRRREPVVIECNFIPELNAGREHYSAFVMTANAVAMADRAAEIGKRPILPVHPNLVMEKPANRDAALFEPYRVETGALDAPSMTIPYDVVAMYAILLAVRQGATELSVVGFDGYTDTLDPRERRMQLEMEHFLTMLRESFPWLRIRSLLPTSYDLSVQSLYGVLFTAGMQPHVDLAPAR